MRCLVLSRSVKISNLNLMSSLFQMIVQTVKTIIPNSAKDIFKSASGIIEIFPTLFKDPMTAVARIGKGVVR